MTYFKEARLNDLRAMEGKRDLLGGPSFSLAALEMFMKAPDFSVLVGGGSGIVLYHEGKGGKSRIMLLVGSPSPEILTAAEASARKAGASKLTAEVDPESGVMDPFLSARFKHAGDVANYFGRGRPAAFMEKLL